MWTVGGIAPANIAVPDGRGGLLGSGTNAPLYTTTFSVSRPKPQEDLANHENRLADALELDRIQRVFEYRHSSTSPPKLSLNAKRPDVEKVSKTSWNGSEWVVGGSAPSESISNSLY